MKKSTFCGLFVALFVMGGTMTVSAADPVNPLDVNLPAGNLVLPEPPAVGTLIWQNDSVRYFEAREIRRLKRAVTVEDSTLLALLGITKKVGTVTTVDSLIAKKREPYISWLHTYGADPAINLPLGDATVFPKLVELDNLCTSMKSYNTHESLYRVRQRPYYYFHDYYKNGKLDEQPTNYDSYPSGHGYFSALFGLCMNYIDPDHVAEIKRNSDTFAEQRLILGAHWASDITAGQTLGAIAFSLALNDPTFKALLDAAKEELANYRSEYQVPARIPDDKTEKRSLEETQTYVAGKLTMWKNNKETIDLQITRTFYCDGYYNSMSLPFDIAKDDWADSEKNPLAGGTLKRFDKAEVIDDVLTITITTDTSVIAGVPYLISFPEGEDIVNPVFKGIQVTKALGGSTPADALNCNGTFVPCDLPKGQDGGYLVLGTKNSLYWPENDQEYLRGFRAYFKANDTQAGAAIRKAKSAKLSEKTMPTGDSQIAEVANSQIYKLIDDGQVIIVRDGVKYGIDGMVR